MGLVVVLGKGTGQDSYGMGVGRGAWCFLLVYFKAAAQF